MHGAFLDEIRVILDTLYGINVVMAGIDGHADMYTVKRMPMISTGIEP